MSNIKLYIINYTVPQYNKIGIASVTAISAQKAQSILQATGKYNAYKYNMSYPVLVHTTDTFTAESIITELDNPAGEKGDRGPQGPKGEKGEKGDPGDPMTWEKMDPEDKMTFKEDAVADIESEIKTKYYPDMSVGMADNLVGRGDVQDAQINFRPSAGVDNITDGAARIERIKGNSVVYNQLISNSRFETARDYNLAGGAILNVDGGIATITLGTSNYSGLTNGELYSKLLVGHKYLFITEAKADAEMQNVLIPYVLSSGVSPKNTVSTEWRSYSFVKEATSATMSYGVARAGVYGTDFQGGEKIYAKSFRVIDLTKEFGAGNEPTSYDEYLQRKPMNIEDEFAYNAGELIDMKVDSLVSVGDNAWDEEWENGTFNTTTGANIDPVKKQIRSKNLIKVLPNTNYTCTIPTKIGDDAIWCMLLDKDKEVITGYTGPNVEKSGNSFALMRYAPSFTTPANAAYLKFYCSAIYGNVYTNDICFHLEQSGYKNGKYYPHQQVSKDLSFINEAFPEGMRSAGSACDEIRFNPTSQRWEMVTTIGKVDMGSIDWAYSPVTDSKPHGFLYSNLNRDLKDSKKGAQCFCIPYAYGSFTDDKSISWNTSQSMVYVRDSSYTDATTFKQDMQGVILYYELAKPIVVELDYPTAETNMDYLVWDFGTEEAIATYGDDDKPIASAPFRADINYEPNAVDDLRWAVSEIRKLKAQLAQVQTSVTNLTE